MKSDELLTAYVELVRTMTSQNPLAEVVKRQADQIDSLQATLDRVVAAKFDRPIERVIHTPADNQLPLFMTSDQGDGAEDIERVMGLVNAENDSEFIAAVEQAA